jgi:hypothetical protein
MLGSLLGGSPAIGCEAISLEAPDEARQYSFEVGRYTLGAEHIPLFQCCLKKALFTNILQRTRLSSHIPLCPCVPARK